MEPGTQCLGKKQRRWVPGSARKQRGQPGTTKNKVCWTSANQCHIGGDAALSQAAKRAIPMIQRESTITVMANTTRPMKTDGAANESPSSAHHRHRRESRTCAS